MSSRELVVLGAVVLIVLLGGFLFFMLMWGVGGMGFGMMGPSMMGPRTGGLGALGWLFCLAPIGLLLLVAVGAGVVWLLRQNDGSSRQALPPSRTEEAAFASCPNCGRPIEGDWQVCPYCGTPLQENSVS